jgi:hypothetical protein
MAGITLAHAQARLDALMAAYDKIVLGQKVEIDGQALTRANLADVQRGIEFWDSKVKQLSASASGRGRMRTVSPLG